MVGNLVLPHPGEWESEQGRGNLLGLRRCSAWITEKKKKLEYSLSAQNLKTKISNKNSYKMFSFLWLCTFISCIHAIILHPFLSSFPFFFLKKRSGLVVRVVHEPEPGILFSFFSSWDYRHVLPQLPNCSFQLGFLLIIRIAANLLYVTH